MSTVAAAITQVFIRWIAIVTTAREAFKSVSDRELESIAIVVAADLASAHSIISHSTGCGVREIAGTASDSFASRVYSHITVGQAIDRVARESWIEASQPIAFEAFVASPFSCSVAVF